MNKISLSLSKFGIFALTISLLIPISSVYGHGFGIDTISSVNVEDKKISISVETPMFFEQTDEKQITITITETETKEHAKNVTLLIGLFHENKMIFRNYFFTPDGILSIKINPTQDDEIMIHGEQDSLLGAWHDTKENPLMISGPIFDSGGLYNFEIEVRTIDEPTNIIENSGVYNADLTIVDTTNFLQKDAENQDIEFKIKSYFDNISNFQYDPIVQQVTFEMPFDWSEKKMSHIPVVHEEVHFPKNFSEFFSPSYTGTANGIELFKASVTVDDYSVEDERIVHFVLLQDHLRFLKNQLEKSGDPLPNSIVFTLTKSENPGFPLTAFTKSEDFQVNLSWDPIEIMPGQNTNFIFTIRDGKTGEPIRNSAYTFVILQNGQEIYKSTGVAQVGGEFEKYTFSEDQTGPTIIKFENIRNSGQETSFGIVVAPEFGTIAIIILFSMLLTVVLISRNYFPKYLISN
ncbi:MAG TPA: PEFG-CTERM sorting domain-containing protein [Nitrosarchaeum sp.]|nr:PEFG-CTERM sorting domain-containing protein [Nitrosarchaeum sp.]